MNLNEAYELVLLKWTLLKKEFVKNDNLSCSIKFDKIVDRMEFSNLLYSCAYCELFQYETVKDIFCGECPLIINGIPCYKSFYGNIEKGIDLNDIEMCRKAIDEGLELIIKTKPSV